MKPKSFTSRHLRRAAREVVVKIRLRMRAVARGKLAPTVLPPDDPQWRFVPGSTDTCLPEGLDSVFDLEGASAQQRERDYRAFLDQLRENPDPFVRGEAQRLAEKHRALEESRAAGAKESSKARLKKRDALDAAVRRHAPRLGLGRRGLAETSLLAIAKSLLRDQAFRTEIAGLHYSKLSEKTLQRSLERLSDMNSTT